MKKKLRFKKNELEAQPLPKTIKEAGDYSF